jgi:hypothetical protein
MTGEKRRTPPANGLTTCKRSVMLSECDKNIKNVSVSQAFLFLFEGFLLLFFVLFYFSL